MVGLPNIIKEWVKVLKDLNAIDSAASATTKSASANSL